MSWDYLIRAIRKLIKLLTTAIPYLAIGQNFEAIEADLTFAENESKKATHQITKGSTFFEADMNQLKEELKKVKSAVEESKKHKKSPWV